MSSVEAASQKVGAVSVHCLNSRQKLALGLVKLSRAIDDFLFEPALDLTLRLLISYSPYIV